ncbi:hypothetical protein BH09ACT7_BH09ACT7_09650 [soil metagenome]
MLDTSRHPRDPCLAYQFLRVEWRTIQHYGVEIDGRIYRGPSLTGYLSGEKSPHKERKGQWPFHVDLDDVRQVYIFDTKSTQRWHALVWPEAPVCDGPMTEDGLLFARKLAKAKHRHFDDKLALAEMLERRHLSQGLTAAERRAALRVARQQSTLGLDVHAAITVSELPTAATVLSQHASSADAAGDGADFDDDLDDDPRIDDGHFYDDVLEDI